MSTPSYPPIVRRWPAPVILALFLMLGVIYSVSTPVREASDELRHYPFVRLLAEGGGLPVRRAGETPIGDYRVTVGLYDPATGERAPLLDAVGAPADSQFTITTLRVAP